MARPKPAMILADEDGREVEFAISRDNRLLLNGQEVVTRQTVRLEGWTFALAALATGGTLLAATWPIAVHFGLAGPALLP